jgi:ribosome-binding factor A
MTQHDKQLASVLQRAVQTVLARGLSDPRIAGLVSVTGIDVSPDGTQARVLVSVHPDSQTDITMHGLRHAAPHIRQEVSKLIKVRRMPRLEFCVDRSLKRQAEVLAAIERAVGGDASAAPAPSPPSTPEDSAP